MIDFQDIPPSIVTAICRVKATVEAVKKTQRNQHGGYQFASTDDIYAAVARKMGEVGLLCLPLEVDFAIERREVDDPKGGKKTAAWMSVVYQFVLATADASWTHKNARRSLLIQYTGPQSHQAAASYAEKAWLRGLFKLPTGDMDLDGMPQADTVEAQEMLSGNGARRKSSAAAKRDGDDKIFNEIRAAIAKADSMDALDEVPRLYSDQWGQLPQRWDELIHADWQAKADDLRARMS